MEESHRVPRGDNRPANELASVANDRADAMFDLHAELRNGQISLSQAFRELGLGFDPAVSEEAAAFAVDSMDAFADLFNACVDMQESREETAVVTSGAGQLNSDGARKITMYAGAEPDDIDHAAFSGVPGAGEELHVGAVSLMRPEVTSVPKSPIKRERRRSREIDGKELSPEPSPGDPAC